MSFGLWNRRLIPVTLGIANLSLYSVLSIINTPHSLAQQLSTPPQPTATQSPQAENPITSYILGPGDRLSVNIFDAPEYSVEETQVLINGTINLPAVGSIFVQGLTLEQARATISAEYNSILKRPVVTINLLDARPMRIEIAGEVDRPGFYTLSLYDPESRIPELQYPTITDAIDKAGGVTIAADVRQIVLRRPQPSGSEQTIHLNLWDFFQNGNFSQNITLRDGDSIYIPSTTHVNPGEVRQLSNTNLATKLDNPVNVTIIGAVQRPGTYVLIGGSTRTELRLAGRPTVTSALGQAGGITAQANVHQVEIHRITRNNTQQIIPVNLWELLQTGDVNKDPLLQDGDTIVIPTVTAVNPGELPSLAKASFATPSIKITVVGEVGTQNSIALEVPIDTTLNQALLAAGGVNRRADQKFVELIRLNPDGSVSQRKIEIDYSQTLNEQTNPLLRENDIIVVPRSGLTRFSDWGLAISHPVNAIGTGLTIPSRIFLILDSLNIIDDD
ncbi:MAG: SLBB domain-containing protein [Lyngbya sp.]|nr:SLBB domain-containing protein [Lyngbya sp.]